MPHLAINNLSHRYGRSLVLRDVTAKFDPGLTTLLGVNGAGKTTLLRLVAGDLRHRGGGSIVLDPDGERPRLMPQFPRYVWRLTAAEYVKYCAWLGGAPPRELASRAEAALERVGLAEAGARPTSRLSGGMLRRLALAATLASGRVALLLDEPMSGLDPIQQVEVAEAIRTIATESVVVMSTHGIGSDDLVGDQIVLLHGGTVAFAGAATRFVSEAPGHADGTAEAFRRWTAAAGS